MSQPGPMGWGIPNEPESAWVACENKTRDEIAQVAPEMLSRHSAREAKNAALETEVREAIKAGGWEEGFNLSFLFKHATKLQPAWLRQIIGSCVASGDQRTTAYRMAAEVFLLNDPEELPGTKLAGRESLAFFAPFNYRAGRREAGINGRSDGSLCLPHIRGKMKFGHLPCNTPGLQSDAFPEPQRGDTYKDWGANNTLMDQFLEPAAKFKLLESEPVGTVDAVHELICTHFKPSNICSMWGFKSTNKKLGLDAEGNPVYQWTRSGTWAHNMSVIGHQKFNGTWYVIIENSWENFHNGGKTFAVEVNEMARWLRDAQCQSVGEIDLADNAPAIHWG
jgi:hypothetical protein